MQVHQGVPAAVGRRGCPATGSDEPEAQWERLVKLTLGHQLIAPEVLPYELGNALTAMMKKRVLEADELALAWDAVQQIPVELRPVDIRAALKIAGMFKIYAYDTYVLDCAVGTRSPLLTLDQRLQAVAAEAGVETLGVEV